MPIDFLPAESQSCLCDILDKTESSRNYVTYMLNRTSQMFEYEGLPDTIPSYILETYLQVFGKVFFLEHNGGLYALPGKPGGPPDPYFRPTQVPIANPALGISATYRISNHLPPYNTVDWSALPEAVMMRNDTHSLGLFSLNSRYATELTENDISIRCAQINMRIQSLIGASTDRELASANEYINSITAGKTAIVAEAPFLEGIHVENVTGRSNDIIQLIELQQYLKASWFNEIGLNSNFNMKREYLSAEEIRSSTDMLLPLCDDMLMRREEALDAVNSTFGTNITVYKNSVWEEKEAEIAEASMEVENQETITEEEVGEGQSDEQ